MAAAEAAKAAGLLFLAAVVQASLVSGVIIFGGSPDRVLETIVDGQTRYTHTEREEQWREVRNTASAARRRMLAPRQ